MRGLPDTFRTDEALAALCILEWVMDVIVDGHPNRNDQIVGLVSDFGYGGMRSACLQGGLIAEAVHAYASADFNGEVPYFDMYDWDFIPAFCRALDWPKLLHNNQYDDGAWRGDVPAIWATMVAQRALAPGRRAA